MQSSKSSRLETRDSVSTTFLTLSSIPSVPADASVPRNSPAAVFACAALIFSCQQRLLNPVNCAEPDPALWSSPAVPYRGIGGPSNHSPTPSGEGPERVPDPPRLPQDPCRSIPRCNPRTRLLQVVRDVAAPIPSESFLAQSPRVLVVLISMGSA